MAEVGEDVRCAEIPGELPHLESFAPRYLAANLIV